jgi:hypothetical protein
MGEEGLVAEHGVEQEALVAVGGGLAEGRGVVEVHGDGADGHGLRRGHLGAEAEADAFVGLDAHGDDVGLDGAAVAECAAIEDHQRRLLELDADLGSALEALAGADVEGNAGPAPVVDFELDGGVGLGAGFGIDAILLAVAGDILARFAGAVLAADGVVMGMAGWPARP